MQKESDRNRMRDANAQEDKMLGDGLKDFERDMDKITGERYIFLVSFIRCSPNSSQLKKTSDHLFASRCKTQD